MLQQVVGGEDAHLIQTVVCARCRRRCTSPENIGHFGLALDALRALHFADPALSGPGGASRDPPRPARRHGRIPVVGGRDGGARPAVLVQGAARRRGDARRAVVAQVRVHARQARRGIRRLVTGVVDFGLFVQVKGVQVDGLVHVSRARHRLLLARQFRLSHGRRAQRPLFRLGDHLRVRLINVIIDERKIDFELADTSGSTRGARAVAATQRSPPMSETSVVFGLHAVRTLLQQRPERCVAADPAEEPRGCALDGIAAARAGGRRARRNGADATSWIASQAVSATRARACRFGALGPLGEGALDELLDRAAAPPLLLVLDGVQDPHNLGACLRTADACGASAVIVPRDRAAATDADGAQGRGGRGGNDAADPGRNLARTLRWLKEREIWVVGADDQASQSLFETKLTGGSGAGAGRGGRRPAPADPGALRRAGRHPDGRRRGKPECLGGGRGAAVRGRPAADLGIHRSCPNRA